MLGPHQVDALLRGAPEVQEQQVVLPLLAAVLPHGRVHHGMRPGWAPRVELNLRPRLTTS